MSDGYGCIERIKAMKTLTDSEYAVTLDSLSMTRDSIRAEGRDTPNIDSALAKLSEGITPWTNGIRFELIQPNDID